MTNEIQELQQLLKAMAEDLVQDMPLHKAATQIGVPEANLRRVVNGHGMPSMETAFWLFRAAGFDLLKILAQK